MISKNLYADDSIYTEGEMPYFWLLLGHNESWLPFTLALDLTRVSELPYSGAYFFEFITLETGAEIIATKFRDDLGVVTEIELACSTAERKACEKGAFRSFIEERLAITKQVDCNEDYPAGVHTYADTDAFIEQLLKEIGVSAGESTIKVIDQ